MNPKRGEDVRTSLIFPTYNPGAGIVPVWEATRDFLESTQDSWEVLFVCDGCSDGTPERLQALTASNRLPVRVLTYDSNRGKGFAVRQGMLAARGDYRIFADVDLAYGFDDIERIAKVLWSGAEMAIASRDHPGSEVVFPPRLLGYLFRRHMQSEVFGALARFLLPIKHRDTQAGLKGMTATAARQIVPRLRCNGFGFDCELLTACNRFGFAIEEVPARVRYQDAASTTGWRTVRRMLGDLFKIRREWTKSMPEPFPLDECVRELTSLPEQTRAAA